MKNSEIISNALNTSDVLFNLLKFKSVVSNPEVGNRAESTINHLNRKRTRHGNGEITTEISTVMRGGPSYAEALSSEIERFSKTSIYNQKKKIHRGLLENETVVRPSELDGDTESTESINKTSDTGRMKRYSFEFKTLEDVFDFSSLTVAKKCKNMKPLNFELLLSHNTDSMYHKSSKELYEECTQERLNRMTKIPGYANGLRNLRGRINDVKNANKNPLEGYEVLKDKRFNKLLRNNNEEENNEIITVENDQSKDQDVRSVKKNERLEANNTPQVLCNISGRTQNSTCSRGNYFSPKIMVVELERLPIETNGNSFKVCKVKHSKEIVNSKSVLVEKCFNKTQNTSKAEKLLSSGEKHSCKVVIERNEQMENKQNCAVIQERKTRNCSEKVNEVNKCEDVRNDSEAEDNIGKVLESSNTSTITIIADVHVSAVKEDKPETDQENKKRRGRKIKPIMKKMPEIHIDKVHNDDITKENEKIQNTSTIETSEKQGRKNKEIDIQNSNEQSNKENDENNTNVNNILNENKTNTVMNNSIKNVHTEHKEVHEFNTNAAADDIDQIKKTVDKRTKKGKHTDCAPIRRSKRVLSQVKESTETKIERKPRKNAKTNKSKIKLDKIPEDGEDNNQSRINTTLHNEYIEETLSKFFHKNIKHDKKPVTNSSFVNDIIFIAPSKAKSRKTVLPLASSSRMNTLTKPLSPVKRNTLGPSSSSKFCSENNNEDLNYFVLNKNKPTKHTSTPIKPKPVSIGDPSRVRKRKIQDFDISNIERSNNNTENTSNGTKKRKMFSMENYVNSKEFLREMEE